jgi:hypothetical protein
LLTCLGRSIFACYFAVPGGGVACYCTDSACSAGINGYCAAPFEAVAGTTDPAELLRQLGDPTTTVARVFKEAQHYSSVTSCDQYCGCF